MLASKGGGGVKKKKINKKKKIDAPSIEGGWRGGR